MYKRLTIGWEQVEFGGLVCLPNSGTWKLRPAGTIGWELALAVSWGEDELVVLHAGAVQDILCIAFLEEVEAIHGALDIDAEEEAQLAQVLDSKLGA